MGKHTPSCQKIPQQLHKKNKKPLQSIYQLLTQPHKTKATFNTHILDLNNKHINDQPALLQALAHQVHQSPIFKQKLFNYLETSKRSQHRHCRRQQRHHPSHCRHQTQQRQLARHP